MTETDKLKRHLYAADSEYTQVTYFGEGQTPETDHPKYTFIVPQHAVMSFPESMDYNESSNTASYTDPINEKQETLSGITMKNSGYIMSTVENDSLSKINARTNDVVIDGSRDMPGVGAHSNLKYTSLDASAHNITIENSSSVQLGQNNYSKDADFNYESIIDLTQKSDQFVKGSPDEVSKIYGSNIRESSVEGIGIIHDSNINDSNIKGLNHEVEIGFNAIEKSIITDSNLIADSANSQRSIMSETINIEDSDISNVDAAGTIASTGMKIHSDKRATFGDGFLFTDGLNGDYAGYTRELKTSDTFVKPVTHQEDENDIGTGEFVSKNYDFDEKPLSPSNERVAKKVFKNLDKLETPTTTKINNLLEAHNAILDAKDGDSKELTRLNRVVNAEKQFEKENEDNIEF